MSKKTGGLFAALTVVAAGAAALFLSKKENREVAQREITKVATKAKKVGKELQQTKAVKDLEQKGKRLADKVVKAASSTPAVKKATKAIKKTAQVTKKTTKKTVKKAATKTAAKK